LIEYTLLLAFVCMASAALFISAGGSIGGIWTAANSNLAAGNTAAAS
jgi:Flp pilus assembly pilin Flp